MEFWKFAAIITWMVIGILILLYLFLKKNCRTEKHRSSWTFHWCNDLWISHGTKKPNGSWVRFCAGLSCVPRVILGTWSIRCSDHCANRWQQSEITILKPWPVLSFLGHLGPEQLGPEPCTSRCKWLTEPSIGSRSQIKFAPMEQNRISEIWACL